MTGRDGRPVLLLPVQEKPTLTGAGSIVHSIRIDPFPLENAPYFTALQRERDVLTRNDNSLRPTVCDAELKWTPELGPGIAGVKV